MQQSEYIAFINPQYCLFSALLNYLGVLDRFSWSGKRIIHISDHLQLSIYLLFSKPSNWTSELHLVWMISSPPPAWYETVN